MLRVAVTGATGVIGRHAVTALVAAGHDVVGLARTPEKAGILSELGATPARTSLSDRVGLTRMFDGADAVCSLATRIPVGYAAARPGAWRTNDRLRTEGVRRVVDAARAAGVRRIVQESISLLYADQGENWIDEQSPLGITRATEPAAVAESHVQQYACESRAGVVLRFGLIVGDDEGTRWQLRAARHGRPVGLGRAAGWMHAVHTDDLGPSVVAALHAPSGTYNVGAEPVRRAELRAGYAEAVGRPSVDPLGPALSRLAGPRAEPLARSLRVSSEQFTAASGWTPRRQRFEVSWFNESATRHQVTS